jgi:DNA-binding MarR family transcriptional regulator
VKSTTSNWKFLTNHALVLSWIAQHPHSTARETAMSIGITERTALKIIGELDTDGYVDRRRKGRRNVYRIIPEAPLRHHLGAHVSVGELLAVIAQKRRLGAA